MSKVKYITFDTGLIDDIVIFSDMQQHAEIARGLPGTPISAGFISIGVNQDYEIQVKCYGNSISLKLESRPEEDERLARRALNLERY